MAQFYTLEEAARALGMNADELKQKAQHREVRAFLDSGSWRFRVSDIDELARRRGMDSDPDLSLSDLDLPTNTVEQGSGDIDISDDSVFNLGVSRPDVGPASMESVPSQESGSDADILLDDASLPMGGGSSSHILGMDSPGKMPSDSDVRLVPDSPKGSSDSDVQLSGEINVIPPLTPGDSDVTLVHENTQEGFDAFSSGSGSDEKPSYGNAYDQTTEGGSDETTLRPSPIGSSDEIHIESDSDSAIEDDSDFELTPSSVIDALQPESGSDFELNALDASDEFESAAPRPSDSDVTGAEPSSSGVNLGKPSDSGINLQQVGGLGEADSIELSPLDDDADDPRNRPAPKKKPAASRPDPGATAMPGLDPGATAMPGLSPTSDPSATALPIGNQQKDIFEDTDFEVDALDSGDDQTMQIDASSDFDLDDSDSASEVFALDEDDVDQSAATALGPALADDDEMSSGSMDAELSDSEEMGEVGWDEEATPSGAAAAATAAPASGRKAGGSALLTDAGGPPWGGIWVGVLGVTSVLMMLLAFVTMDVVRNLNAYQGDTPVASGLVKVIAGGE